MTTEPMLFFSTREEWRDWLEKNHVHAKLAWLIYHNSRSDMRSIDYESSVEEALCFGWIDSIIKNLDDCRYMRKFTPRTDRQNWSALNISRLKRLIASGQMTPAGLSKIDPKIIVDGTSPRKPILRLPEKLSDDLSDLLKANRKAGPNFEKLPSCEKRRVIGWVMSGVKETTRIKRMTEVIETLASGEKICLK